MDVNVRLEAPSKLPQWRVQTGKGYFREVVRVFWKKSLRWDFKGLAGGWMV